MNRSLGQFPPPCRWATSLTISFASVAMLICNSGFAAESEPEFRTLFNGQTLDGWSTADPSYWTVEDGAITGTITREHPCNVNQYLVWSGGEPADFELRLKSRLTGEGGINNGFQFRSRLLPDHDICGYQVDNNLQTPWLARLYDEYGRHTLAWRGERTVFDAEGNRQTTKLSEAEGDAWFRLEDWHEYRLVCVGPRITLSINDRIVAEVEDHDLRRQELQGVLALQLHSGPPTRVQFKNIRLKVLKATAPTTFRAEPLAKQTDRLTSEAVAWWRLDTGGHGASPSLRHQPQWEKFELNVKASSEGPLADRRVVVLDGAHFEAGPDVLPTPEQLTLYVRLRDPRGDWNAALINRQKSSAQTAFRLDAARGPDGSDAEIRFALRTDQGASMVRFPVSDMGAHGWHDLAVRYDGQMIELFCDGRRMAGTECSGRVAEVAAPLMIGAEREGESVQRHFHGELEIVGLWSRALSPKEIAAISASGK